jgi:glycosyltransferase involved in cell wall biosynthesis
VLSKGSARLAGLFRLASELRSRRIDVVNGHNPTGSLYATLAARMAGVPVVLRTEHSIHYPGRGGRLYAPLEGWLTRQVDRVIGVCEAATRSHAARFPGLASRFVTVCNGVSMDVAPPRPRAEVRAELAVAAAAPVVLTVGSLTPQKSQDVLLAAMAKVARNRPDAMLLIAGEGRLRAALEAQRAALGLERTVRFLGARHDVTDLLAASDLMVLSSSREGLPVTLLEAMRAGRAALATDVGGNAEAIAEGVNGRIVPVGDIERMAAALQGLLADAAELARFGDAGKERWRERFTAERMVRDTETLYRAALARRGRSMG